MSLLAQRVEAASMLGADPFAKIKGLIQEMIEKLEEEAAKEAAHKAFCDKEMKETKAKKEDKETDLDDLSTKIDKATAKIAKLTGEIATLEEELGAIAKAQQEADKIRAEEKAAWAEAKADYESGIEGVGMALKVLRDYYAEKEESLIQEAHVKATAVKYKTKDKKETEEMLVGLKEDKETTEKEYAAVMEYWEELQGMCIAKPEPYAERKRRREAEIAGLKEALTIL